jgi:hypothetical protein
LTQVFFAHKGGLPDQAALSTFQEKDGVPFVSSDTAKFSPFTAGEQIQPIAREVLKVTKADLASIISIGKCKCGSSHRADVASVGAMLDENTSQFLCLDCGSGVDFAPSMKEYLAIKAKMDTAGDGEGEESDGDVNTDDTESTDDSGDETDSSDETDDSEDMTDETDDSEEDSGDEGDGEDADIIDDADSEDEGEESDGDVNTDDSEDTEETDASEEDGASLFTEEDLSDEAKFDAIVARLVDEASEELGDFAEDAVETEKPAASVSTDAPAAAADVKTETAADAVDPVVEPTDNNIVADAKTMASDQAPTTETISDACGDKAKALFTGGDDNPEDKTLAEIIANPIGADSTNDNATLIPLDAKVNFKLADVACVLNANKTAYFVFADNLPVGTLSRERAHPDNAKLFEQDVFATAFANQMARGLDVSRFGYAPYTVKVDVDAERKRLDDKVKADVASVVSQEYDAKLAVVKESLLTVATAANKGVWPDLANPVRDAIVNKLAAIGVEDCAALVDKAFAAKSGEHIEMLLTQALKLSELPAEVRAERKRAVDTAKYVVAPEGNKLAEKLASFGTLAEAAPVNTGKTVVDTAAVVAKPSGKFNWANAFK